MVTLPWLTRRACDERLDGTLVATRPRVVGGAAFVDRGGGFALGRSRRHGGTRGLAPIGSFALAPLGRHGVRAFGFGHGDGHGVARQLGRDHGLPLGRVACALRHCVGHGPFIRPNGAADLLGGRAGDVVRHGRLGRARTLLSRDLSVPTHGPVRCVLDRRHVQPVRVLRGLAHRVLCLAAARPRQRALPHGRALRGAQPHRLGPVPHRLGHVVFGDRYAEHGRHGGSGGTTHRRFGGLGQGRGLGAFGGVWLEGGLGASVLLVARHLRRGQRTGGGLVCHHDQGRCLQHHPHALGDLRCRCGRGLAGRGRLALALGPDHQPLGRARCIGGPQHEPFGGLPDGVFGGHHHGRCGSVHARHLVGRAVLHAAQHLGGGGLVLAGRGHGRATRRCG